MQNSNAEALAVSLAIGHHASLVKDFVCIRGVSLPMDELVDPSLFDPARQATLRAKLLAATPFPHLVLQDLINPALLELVVEEFDTMPASSWLELVNAYEKTRRSAPGAVLGAASTLYFNLVHSAPFLACLSKLIAIPDLLPDPRMAGGGMHESRPGAHFAVHRDFRRHRATGLTNEMVMITYLNKGWQPQWGSALELWDERQEACVERIQPEFGRTLVMPHGPTSFHGHPDPMQTPDGRCRRSVATYYYSSPYQPKDATEAERSSLFMHTRTSDRLRALARNVTPPAVWAAARKLRSSSTH